MKKQTYELSIGILATIFIIVFLLVLLLFPLPSKPDTIDQQVVLQVTSNGTEDKLVTPKAIVVLRLSPLSGPTAKTPLSRGDMMICRTYDFVDEQHIPHAGFKCGTDVYVINGIRYDSK